MSRPIRWMVEIGCLVVLVFTLPEVWRDIGPFWTVILVGFSFGIGWFAGKRRA